MSTQPSRTFLRALPKCELHLHLEGTISPSTLVTLSARNDTQPLTPAEANALYEYTTFHGFLDAFFAITQRLQQPRDYELVAYNMLLGLAAQGVRHAEVYVSFSNISRWKPHLALSAVTAALERGRLRAELETGTTAYWIVDLVRQHGSVAAEGVLDQVLELRRVYPSIVGIGIGGDEAGGPAKDFVGVYERARMEGLRCKAHAGEAEPARSIWDALDIGAERIGHGLAAGQDPVLLERLARDKVPLEMCVTSNLRTGCCGSLKEHPLRRYVDAGLVITLNSDDPEMFGSDLLDEYVLVQEEFGFEDEAMVGFARNSIVASFLPEERKAVLLRELQKHLSR